MDPNSSLEKICLGENVVEISSDKIEGSGDWNSLEFQDTANSGQKNETKAMVFLQMDIEEVSDRSIAPLKLCLEHEVKRGNKVVKKELIVALRGEIYFVKFVINPEEDDVEPGVILGRTFLHKVELDRKNVKEEEEAVKRIKGEALKEKDDPRAFIFPVRLEGKVNENALADTGLDINTMPNRIYKTLRREDIKKVDRGITMIIHTQAEAMGVLTNILCQVGLTTIIAKFLILDIPINRDPPIVAGRGFLYTISSILNTPKKLFSTFDGICHQTFRAAKFDVLITTKSNSDDEEEYQIKRNEFGAPIYGLKPAPYLNYNDPAEQSLALQAVINPF
nr:hypothetical protein [Tanacetum cinerariifolium]